VRFYTCDVFTTERHGGNPLAVLPDARGLDDEQMLAIAREFNYSETTFVLPPEAGHTRRVRIFTPYGEIPFAGHPNVGTAFTLAHAGLLDSAETVTFEEEAGLVPIAIEWADGRPLRCELRAPAPLSIGKGVAVHEVASLLSLGPDDIVGTTHPPQSASVGLPFVIAELSSRDALERIRVDWSLLRERGEDAATLVYVRSADDYDVRARCFVPVFEDPATGSANCALAAMLAHYRPEPSGEFRWRIAQGVEMGRPSTLEARVEKRDGEITATRIAGSCVMVSEGELYLD
jgi:trans-2,3-dihydro-3-hydroxyanthranilate isomerase